MNQTLDSTSAYCVSVGCATNGQITNLPNMEFLGQYSIFEILVPNPNIWNDN